MKKLLLLLILCIFLVSCSFSADKVINITVSSEYDSQIQKIDDFRLDKMVLKLTYDNNSIDYKVLDESMLLNKVSKKLGVQKLCINYMGYEKIIELFLYDEDYLVNNYIYYYYYDDNLMVMGCSSINDIMPEINKNHFFGWFDDKNKTISTTDNEDIRISKVYPLFVDYETVRIRFFENNILSKVKYIISGSEIPYYTPLNENFTCWSHKELHAYNSMDIYSISLLNNEHIVRFYNFAGEQIEYSIVRDGSSINDCYFNWDDKSFLKWSEDLENIKSDLDCYPIVSNTYNVYIYDQFSNLLYIDNVLMGEDSNWILNQTQYEILSYEGNINNIMSDSIVVADVKYMQFYYYYNDVLLCKSYRDDLEFFESNLIYYEYEYIKGDSICIVIITRKENQ
ncbi:MAG: hypothetical protein ACI35W_07820 [Anaeroplasmataceae bacterium]